MPNQPIQVDAYVKLIRTAEALHAEVSRGLAQDKVTASQFSAMKALRYHGTMAQKDVATFMLKTAGNVTLVLDNLERQGFISRERQQDDRRVVNVTLTELGKLTFDRLYPEHIQRILTAMSGLDAHSAEQIIVLLQSLHTSINDPQCAPPEQELGRTSAL